MTTVAAGKLAAGKLPAELAGRLNTQLELPEPWLDAFRRVPRHLFLPDRVWRLADETLVPIDRTADPRRWIEAAYSDDAIITLLDGDMPTSSCSMPYLVARMLELLDPQPGHRVLEIGTGTGWNAALLAHRLGPGQVVTVEVDPEVADQARRNLAAAGAAPIVVTGDGVVGHPDRAPYNRIIATCAVSRVPYAWVQQAVPRGVIVTPWDSLLGLGGLLRLIVANGTGSGRFADPSSFMWLRGHQQAMPDEPDDFDRQAVTSKVAIDLAAARENLARFVIGLLVPGCQPYGYRAGEVIWLLAAESWASVDTTTGVVRQLGTRRLWGEIEAAYRWWDGAGRPDLTRFGITVTADRQQVWLDEPGQLVGIGDGLR